MYNPFCSVGVSDNPFCSDSVFAKLAAVHASTGDGSFPPSGSQSQRRSASISSSLHIPSLMFLLWHPTSWCPNHLFSLPSYNNSYPNKLSLQSYSLPAGGTTFLALSGLGCLYWARDGDPEIGWVLPDVMQCGQAAGSHCFVQQLVLPGCMREADASVELLVPMLQVRVFACTETGALFSTWHCCWNDFCTIIWESMIKKCCGWSSLFTVQ